MFGKSKSPLERLESNRVESLKAQLTITKLALTVSLAVVPVALLVIIGYQYSTSSKYTEMMKEVNERIDKKADRVDESVRYQLGKQDNVIERNTSYTEKYFEKVSALIEASNQQTSERLDKFALTVAEPPKLDLVFGDVVMEDGKEYTVQYDEAQKVVHLTKIGIKNIGISLAKDVHVSIIMKGLNGFDMDQYGWGDMWKKESDYSDVFKWGDNVTVLPKERRYLTKLRTSVNPNGDEYFVRKLDVLIGYRTPATITVFSEAEPVSKNIFLFLKSPDPIMR